MFKFHGYFLLLSFILSACSLNPQILQPTVNPQASPDASGILPGPKEGILPGPKDGILPDSKGGILPGPKDGILPGPKDGILPGTKDGILPGTKGGILPGSKAEITLALEVRLPDYSAFATQAVDDDISRWTVQIDQQSYAVSRLLSQSVEQDESVLKLELQKVQVPVASHYQEVKVYSSQKVLQTAAIVPALQVEQQALSEAVTTDTLAQWLLVKEYEQALNQNIAQLSQDEYRELLKMPEVKELAKALKMEYLKSKGTADPTQSPCIKQQAQSHSQKLLAMFKKKPVNLPPTANQSNCSPTASPVTGSTGNSGSNSGTNSGSTGNNNANSGSNGSNSGSNGNSNTNSNSNGNSGSNQGQGSDKGKKD